jgi:alpha-galactosidase
LWVTARSPLMMGGDLPTTDDETLDLLANPALSEMLRSSYDGREVIREPIDDGELIVWTARSEDDIYVAVFWTGPTSRKVSVPLASVGAGASEARDLWDGTAQPVTGQLEYDVPAHGVRWLKLSAAAS